MAYKQIVAPRLGTQDGAGWCLRFTQSVYGAPAMYPSAWTAWLNQKGKHYTRKMPNVSVPVWFSHYGTYGSPPTYANWGHVVAWVPGRGFLSSPGAGWGQQWFPSIAAVENYFGAGFVGWTEYMHTLRVARFEVPTKPPVKPVKPQLGGDQMFMIRMGSKYAVVGPNFWMEFSGPGAASNILAQITGNHNAQSLAVSKAFWDHCKKAATG